MDASNTNLSSGVFVAKTAHGTIVRMNPATGEAYHSQAPGDAAELIVYVPPGDRTAAFVMAAQPSTAAIHIDAEAPAKIMTLRVRRTLGSADVAFCQPFTGLYLCAAPLLPGGQQAGLVINRPVAGRWETFQLMPIEPARLSPQTQAAVAALQRWADRPITGPDLLAIIEEGLNPSEADAFAAFARLLPQDQIAWLGPTILGRPVALRNIAATFPDDWHAATALPDLGAWLAARPKVSHIHLPATLDGLAEAALDGTYRSFWQTCNFYARRNIPPRHGVCVLATARNEGIYLLEWIAYHRSIGVEAFFIYSNDNSDGSDELLAALAQAGVITWISSELAVGSSAQPKAYGHALQLLPNILDYRWTLIIDLDEFFAFDRIRFARVQDYVAWQETCPVDAMVFNWLVFGSGGENAWRDAPLTSRFVTRLPWLDPHVKTMVRTNQALHSHPHHPVTDSYNSLTTRNASGALHVPGDGLSFSATPEADTAWVNHYFLKSAEEFVWKFSRNRGDHALVRHASAMAIDPSFLDMFVKQHTSPHVQAEDRILAFAGGITEHVAALSAIPGVSESMRVIRHRFQEAIAQHKAVIATLPAFQVPGSLHARLAEFLGR